MLRLLTEATVDLLVATAVAINKQDTAEVRIIREKLNILFQ